MISSLVSYSRRHIHEEIPGLLNAIFDLPPAMGDIPTIMHIDDSAYYKPDLDGNQDKIRVSSEEIVRSLVHMHTTSQLAWNIDQHPALFCLPNEQVTLETLRNRHAEKIEEALRKQRKWFRALVQIADDDWQQLRRHNMISDIQRTAARELGLTREWLLTIEDEENTVKEACPFCGTGLLDPSAPICPTCGKIHNPAKLRELELRLNPPATPAKPS